MENVPGILSIDNGKFKNKIIRRFRKIGYFIEEPYILDAADFGVPQKRKRVFFIGFLDAGIELNFKPNGSKKVTVAEAISDLPKLPVGGGGVNSMLYTNGFNSNYQKKMRGKCKIVFNHVSTKSRDHIIERFKKIKQGENWKSVKSMLNYKKVENTHSMIYKRLKWTDPAVTIANFRKSMLIHPRQNRLLSVREAARLQSFPDSYVFEGSLSSMQQQVADAVPPLLAQAVANEISKNLK
jgi:DNA (cytosine-5)-methyltransferase 1